jgi:hypothetical protein
MGQVASPCRIKKLLLQCSNEFWLLLVTAALHTSKNVSCFSYATYISKCESWAMQAVVRMSTVNAVSKFLPRVRAELSSFTAPLQDVLRPARGIIYALKLALVFWALVGAALLKWAML